MSELKRQLGVWNVFAIAAGAMISSGLFVLPGIAFSKAGPAVILSYLFASLLMIPSVLCQAELSTAMPKAGGMYFYIERSFGSASGLFSGLADWFSLALKSAFAIVGVAVFVNYLIGFLFKFELPEILMKSLAVGICLFFAFLNVVSVKQTGRFQVILVLILLVILCVFVFGGVGYIELDRYKGFTGRGWSSIFKAAGLVFVSYGGLNKVVNVAEEVHRPSRNLPLGIGLAWGIVTVFYVAVVAVTVGVLPAEVLENSLLPISKAASVFMHLTGFVLLGLAALAAFVTTANAGILAASRSPMAMSRDRLLPAIFSSVHKRFQTPYISIILTSGFMIIAIIFLDVEMLAKTASTLLLILFILANASVIIMRESRIQSYRPKFKSPFYPYLHIFAILSYSALIADMGKVPLTICAVFISFSALWYFLYASKRVGRASAAMHIVERVTDRELKTVTLENELRDILIERDEIIEDRFDQLIKHCEIIDIQGRCSADEVFRQVSSILETRLDTSEYVLLEKFIQREAEGGTVVEPGFAIPHIVVEGENKFDVLLVRAREGINFPHAADPVRIMFVLAGSKDKRNYHLRALMAIAQIGQEKQFAERWLEARDIESLRNLILLSARKRDTAG